MAFDRPDTDAFYQRLLRPTIRSIGARAVRVNDVNHNDDINNKMLELLDQADFVVADLTYARPSVYYEAGYAAPRPVVYTCRSDHLDHPTEDLRVHLSQAHS
jgi:nucleoside 2-deoxyribosyltransferase